MLPVACPATLHPMRLDRLTWIRKLETDSSRRSDDLWTVQSTLPTDVVSRLYI
jgi:hypothetical protein